MFSELNAVLDHSPDRPPQGNFILLSDSLADGSFLIHHFLSLFLKGGHRVCFVSLSQTFSHYNAVGLKLGVNLTSAVERNQLVFVDGLKYSLQLFESRETVEDNPFRCLRDEEKTLQPLYQMIRDSLLKSSDEIDKPVLVLIDDLSMFLSIGFSVVNVYDIMHYLVTMICGQLKSPGCLVTFIHTDKDVEDEENDLIFKQLSYHSNLHLHAEGLSSGYCKDVHGQLSISWNDPRQISASRAQHKILQYKIQDKNVTFFAPGTSSAVL
ncbi:elongator complex protein 6-like isoform X2 [Ptychodera flava]|uniref:elongator complex protein 6-like isoform X2 n=1 Tax=Ptychodera flava TaxID=63121 RepID=UPI00396A935F